ncbi:MAG: hypothetical protein Q9194_007608 [Teloschistes cf. exilis]
MQCGTLLLQAFCSLSAFKYVAADSPHFTSLDDFLSSTAIPPGVTNDLTIATELYYPACPTSVPEISTAACFLQQSEMYSSLVYNIESAAFWNTKIPSNFKGTATDIASKWIHQPAVVAAVSSTTGKTFDCLTRQKLTAIDVSPWTASTPATLIPTASGVAPTTTVSQAPSPTQSISSIPMPTRSLNGFQRLSVTAQIFTIFGPFIGATVAVLLFVLTLRHQRRKKARVAGHNERHGMPDSEAGTDKQQGAVNATTDGNGTAVAGTRDKNRSDHHRGHRNRNYNSVYIGFNSEVKDNAGGGIQPPIAMHHIERHGGVESGTVSSDSISAVTDVQTV